MAKRMTDSEKWEDPWFLDLSSEHKMIWVYVLDKCDYAGVWKVNTSLAAYCFKAPVDFNGFLRVSEGRVMVLDNGKKWFIPGFLKFQYGPYKEGNKMYPKVEAYLLKEGISIHHLSPINGVKDMDMDKVMVKEREKEIEKEFDQLESFNEIWELYPAKGRLKRSASLRVWCEIVISRDIASRIRTALDNYSAHLKANSDWGKQPKELSNWLTEWPDWETHQEPEKEETDAERDARILAKYQK